MKMKLKELLLNHKPVVFRTIFVWFTFLFYGAGFLLPGSSLLDLQVLTQENFVSTAQIINLRSIGFFVGALLVGFICKYCNPILIMAISFILFGITTILTPLTGSLKLMEIYSFISGMSQACLDVAAYTYLFDLWKAKVVNVIQILHVCFGLGGLTGPLIVRPFMLPLPKGIQDITSDDEMDNLLVHSFKPSQVKIFWAFVIVGIFTLLSGLMYAIFYVYDKIAERREAESTDDAKNDTKTGKQASIIMNNVNKLKNNHLKQIIVISICASIANAYFGCQILISGFTQTFGVKSDLHMAKKVAALLAPSFWLTYVIGKVFFVLLSLIITEWKLITLFMSLTLISNFILITFAAYSQWLMFFALIIFGFGSSSLFGLSVSLPSRYFHMSARYTSSIFVSGIIGESIHAAIISQLMDDEPLTFIYYLFSLSTFFTASCFLLQCACKKFFPSDVAERQSIAGSIKSTRSGKTIKSDNNSQAVY